MRTVNKIQGTIDQALPASSAPVLQQLYFNLPTGQVPDTMTGLLSYGAKPELYAARRELLGKGNKSLKVVRREVTTKKGEVRTSITFTQETQAGTIDLYLPGLDLLEGYNKTDQKLFNLVLIKLNEQSLHGGSLGRPYISFPLEELVELGVYSNIRAARQGFYDFRQVLTSFKVRGEYKLGKKVKVNDYEVPFIGAPVINGQCIIKLNPDLDWNIIAQSYTILPKYYFGLKSKAADLLYSIFYLARQKQNEDKLKKHGYFTIGYRVLQTRLNLPAEKDTKSPRDKIREPIEQALEEIELENAHTDNDLKLAFESVEPEGEKVSVKDWLDNGYLKVFLDGEYAQGFIEMSTKRAEQIERAIKQRERRQQKAIEAKIAKAVELEVASKGEGTAPAPAPETQAEAPQKRRGRPPKKKPEDSQQLSLLDS